MLSRVGAGLRARQRRGDRGAGIAQYAALVCVAAVLAGILVPMLSGPWLTVKIKHAVCELFHPGDSKACVTSDAKAYTPPYCVRVDKDHQTSLDIHFLWLHGGAKYEFERQELANGNVLITVVPYGWEAGVDWNKGGKISLSGGLSLSIGTTYQFKPHDGKNADQWADKFQSTIKAAASQKAHDSVNPVGWLWHHTVDRKHYKVPNPYVKFKTYGINGEVAVNLGLPGRKSKGKHAAPDEQNDKLDLGTGLSATASVGGSYDTQTWYDPKTGKVTQHAKVFTLTGSLSASASVAGVGVSGSGEWSSAVRILRNKDGSLYSIRFMTKTQLSRAPGWQAKPGGKYTKGKNKHRGKHRKPGSGKGPRGGGGEGGVSTNYTTTHTQYSEIDFSNPQEQAIGEQWLKHNGIMGYISQIVSNMVHGKPPYFTHDPGPGASPFDQLMYSKGKVWQSTSNDVETKKELSASVTLGAELGSAGFDYSSSDKTSKTSKARYLGPPAGGVRTFQPYQPCVAKN